MINDRPIEDPKLQRALNEVKEVLARYGLAGACVLVAETECAFTYKMHAPWSAIRYMPESPLGFRITSDRKTEGDERTHARMEGAVYTVCSMLDFGTQTCMWMEDMQRALLQQGIEWDHTPFNGQPLQHLQFEQRRKQP